jgi:hypothetical protein
MNVQQGTQYGEKQQENRGVKNDQSSTRIIEHGFSRLFPQF